MLPTKHLPKMTTVRSRTEENRKPVCVMDYTANMAGVDKFDQMISHHKTVKWWKKLVLHLLTLVMIQAHTLYNKQGTRTTIKISHSRTCHVCVLILEGCLRMTQMAPEILQGQLPHLLMSSADSALAHTFPKTSLQSQMPKENHRGPVKCDTPRRNNKELHLRN